MTDHDLKAAARDKRLKEALKANLRRRKGQATERQDNLPEQATGVAYSGRVGAKRPAD